jgi:ATP-dependent DNA helicase RecG
MPFIIQGSSYQIKHYNKTSNRPTACLYKYGSSFYNLPMTKVSSTRTLPNTPEQNNIEYKSCSQGRLPADLWQTISAFSNTDGGKIYIGIDPTGSPIGLTAEHLDIAQQNVVSLCEGIFNVPIVPDIIVINNNYLAVEIPPTPAQIRPIFKRTSGTNRGTYVRVGSTNRLANEEHIKRFAVAARGGAETLEYDSMLYPEYLDLPRFQTFVSMLNASRDNMYQKFTAEEILLKQKAINHKKEVTLFGLLAFGKDHAAQEIISPTMNIGVTQYPGSTKVNEDDLSETFLDNREFNGTVTEQFEQAFAFIKTKLPIKGTIDATGRRREYFIIPEVALREALANAIAHRDYSSQSSRIQVDIYSNRLEIINPGMSLVPIQELEIAPSTARNPLLMSYLKEYGITDQKARGIRTIRISIRNAGLVEPAFENSSQFFKVTLYGSAFLSPEDKRWLASFKAFNLSERQLNALAHVHNNETGISNSEYRDINSMNNVRDDKRANKELKIMVALGVLTILGENKARRYVLAETYKKII